MQLAAILLITVSILTLLSGVATFFGATKGDRARSAWFFAATIFATIWTVTIALFMTATPDWSKNFMTALVDTTFLSAIFIDIALLGYIAWRYKAGRITAILFLAAGIVFAVLFIANPSWLYTEIILSPAGNALTTNIGPFYHAYILFFFLLVPAVLITLLQRVVKSRSKRERNSDLVLLIGFAISGTVSLVCNLILPLWTWDYIWLGPLAISTTIIAFYYTILRYRALNLHSIWLKALSYIVIIASIAVLYMVVFYIIFAAMFRGSTPSAEVIVLNFIMVLFFLLLMPAMNELLNVIRNLISGNNHSEPKEIKKETEAKKDDRS